MVESASTPVILIVEDNESTRYMLSRALKRGGFSVIEAKSGAEALDKIREKPDLVTLDVNLPDMSGIEVCKKIKDDPESSAIPVIHVSATFVQSEHKVNALNSGADGYLTHPVEDVVLIATVSAFLRARKAEKERELLLLQSRRDLEDLQMERDMRERFVATLSHDLRTPMTSAKMSAQLILRQPGISEAVQKLVDRVKLNIDRADDMIRDLLDVNLIQAGKKLPLEVSECDLKLIIEETLDNLSSTHGNRFVFHSPSSVTGSWDCMAIRRTIENLVGNAIKYGTPHNPITVSVIDSGVSVEVAVHNLGNPMSVADQSLLFKPYSRINSIQNSGKKGWGLGLTVVQGAVEAHGGWITVESSSDVGTTFRINLPRKTPQSVTGATDLEELTNLE